METGKSTTDRVVAIVALIGLAAYLAVLIWYVPQPALIVVSVLTIALAGFDFVRTAFLGKA